jgi:hypothetical protein
MREDLDASRQPSAMTTSSTLTTANTPIREVKVCLHVKPRTRRSRRRRSACREGSRSEMKIYTTRRSQRKDVVSCFKILATSWLRLTEVTGLTVHATSNRDVDMEFTNQLGILKEYLFLLCFYFVYLIFWTIIELDSLCVHREHVRFLI